MPEEMDIADLRMPGEMNTAGQAAMGNADWQRARDIFAAAVEAKANGPAYEDLSRAAWWLGDEEVTLSAREHAFRAYRSEANPCAAARMAMWLAVDHMDFRGDDAVAAAWIRRGRELISDQEPCPELGFLDITEADLALFIDGDPGKAAGFARRALQIGRQTEDRGVEVVALATLGFALVSSGEVESGIGHLDEAMTLAVTEEFEDLAAPGWALCHTVTACTEIGEFSRAQQWCRILHSWATKWHGRQFFGSCRSAYGEILATNGDWQTAEQELVSAVDDFSASRRGLVAPAVIRLGRLRWRQGDAAESRRLFESALPHPRAIVALGEIDLASGNSIAACDAAERALRRTGSVLSERLPALILLAQASSEKGDRTAAATAIEQATSDAERLGTPYMRARMAAARGRVSFDADQLEQARRDTEDAIDLFSVCGAPFEAAEARLLLGQVLSALGQNERAEAENAAAMQTRAMLAGGTGSGQRDQPAEISVREVEVLRLVADGLNDTQIAERLFLSPHTVHRHIANIRGKLRVASRSAAVAHASRHGLI